jgi:hypothetical protein
VVQPVKISIASLDVRLNPQLPGLNLRIDLRADLQFDGFVGPLDLVNDTPDALGTIVRLHDKLLWY